MRFARTCVAISVVLLSACGFLQTAAATVDGRKIDEDLFQRELDFLLSDPRFAQQQLPGEQGELQRAQLARDFLTFLIHQAVVKDYAQVNDIEAPADEVDALVDQQVQGLGGEEEFRRILGRSGLTEGQVRDLFGQQVLRDHVAEAVLAEEVTDASLRQSYQDRSLEFTRLRVSHILVNSQREADRLAREATPKNFAELADRFSQDPSSAVNGGDLGVIQASDLVEPFARAALRIPVGKIGGPVETEFGFHLIYVRDRDVQPFEEVRDQLLDEVRGDVFSEWLRGRLAEAEIRVNPRYGFFDLQSGQVVERTSTTPEPPVQLQP